VEDFLMPLFLLPKQLKKLFPFFSRRSRRIVPRFNRSRKEEGRWWLETGVEPAWHGYYRTHYGPGYEGRVENLAEPKFYIKFKEFPPQLKGHRHELCFRDQHNNTGWHWVHMSPAPKDVDAGIFAIERTLNDALAPLKKSA
jgi:hypothetical protein